MWLYIGLGGIIGSLLRYCATLIVKSAHFPFATLTVNIVGSFLLGFLSSYFSTKNFQQTKMYTAITTGIIGSFTTFSTFSNDIIDLIEGHEYLFSIVYLAVSIILGLVLAMFGMYIGRKLRSLGMRKDRLNSQ